MNARRAWRLGFAGFGSVNRTLARLLLDRRDELSHRHGLTFTATLVSSRRRGVLTDPAGLDLESLLTFNGDDANRLTELVDAFSLLAVEP